MKLSISIFFLFLLFFSSTWAQPVALTTVLGPDDMELKLIKEEERNQTEPTIREMPTNDKNLTKTSMSSPNIDGSSSQPTVTVSNAASAIQFDNLPKIVTDVSNTIEGGFDLKLMGIKQNETLCSQKLNEMKQLVETQLKRSVYKAECSEPEFARTDSNKIQFSSKATITFF